SSVLMAPVWTLGGEMRLTRPGRVPWSQMTTPAEVVSRLAALAPQPPWSRRWLRCDEPQRGASKPPQRTVVEVRRAPARSLETTPAGEQLVELLVALVDADRQAGGQHRVAQLHRREDADGGDPGPAALERLEGQCLEGDRVGRAVPGE